MDVTQLTYLFVGLSFALYIGIAFWSRARSTNDFYVAGKGVNPIANGMATAADWMSAASFISMAGLIAFLGKDGSVYLMGWTGGYVVLALLLAPYLRKFGRFTVPDFIGERYYSKTARLVAVICLIFVSFTYVAGQMRGVGIVFSRFLEVDINLVTTNFYDGALFHRVIKNFMIQGGDVSPPPPPIVDEFDSTLSNIQKTISMANSGPNTGTCQFFINLVDNTYLDFDKPPFTSKHPVFGITISGFNIVEDIGDVQFTTLIRNGVLVN